MKKLRFGLLTKIIALTGVLTLLTVSSSLTVNALISYNDKRNSYIDACGIMTDNLEGVFANEEENDDESLKFSSILNMVIDKYLPIRNDYDELSDEEVEAYQKDLRLSEFGPSPGEGQMGMSQDKAYRKGLFNERFANMQSVTFINEVPFSAFFLYDSNPNNPDERAVINIMSIDYEKDAHDELVSLATLVEDNIMTFGYRNILPSEAEVDFFDSDLDAKKFIINNTVFSYNRISISLSNTEFKCFVRGQYPFDKVNKEFANQLLTQFLVTAGSAVFLVIIYGLFAKLFLIKNVHKLTDSTNKFVGMMKSDDALEVVESGINSTDEIKELSDAFTVMQGQIITYVDNIKKARDFEEAVNAEVSIASKIQLESLPANTYFDRDLELRAFIKPAKGVGGDFYDYFYIDEDHLAFVVADVSGKGIPASLFMMRSKESIRSASMNEKDLSNVFFKVNNSLCVNNAEGFFVTAFLGVLNLKTHEFNYINAGHERPFIKHNGECSRLKVESNFVLGLEEDFIYKQESIELEEGDSLLLHTDGLNEAINKSEEEFGYERIRNSLMKDDEPKLNIDTVIKDLEEFEGEVEQFDDITILAFKIRKDVSTFFYKNPKYEDIPDLTAKIEECLEGSEIATLSKIGVVIDEVMNNIISYGKTKTNKTLMVTAEKRGDEIVLVFIDNSHPFNPLLKPKQTIPENMEKGIVGGVGISIVTSISKDAEYAYSNNKNILIIKF